MYTSRKLTRMQKCRSGVLATWLKMWSVAHCTRPMSRPSLAFCIVKVLPELVCPYAKIVPFTPRSTSSTRPLPMRRKTSSVAVSSSKTWS